MTAHNLLSTTLPWSLPSGGEVRKAPPMAPTTPATPDVLQPTADLVACPPQLIYPRSASIDEGSYSFPFPEHSSNLQPQSRPDVLTMYAEIIYHQISRLGAEIDRCLAEIREVH